MMIHIAAIYEGRTSDIMHIKKNILFVLIIFVFQLIPPVMAYNKTENPILFETDFENCRKNYFPGLEFVYNLRAEVSQVDAEHGKSVGLNANNMIYWIDNPWKDGCYSLSFDFYDTAKGQFNYLRAIFDKNVMKRKSSGQTHDIHCYTHSKDK